MSKLDEIKARAAVSYLTGTPASQDEAKDTLKLIGALEAVLSHASAEVEDYHQRGSNMIEYDQLEAAGRADYARELVQRISEALA